MATDEYLSLTYSSPHVLVIMTSLVARTYIGLLHSDAEAVTMLHNITGYLQ
jgi:hypothetical protein